MSIINNQFKKETLDDRCFLHGGVLSPVKNGIYGHTTGANSFNKKY